MPAAGEIHRLKKWRSPARFLAGDHSVKHNGHFALSSSRLNLIYSRQPNFLATTLQINVNHSLRTREQIIMKNFHLLVSWCYLQHTQLSSSWVSLCLCKYLSSASSQSGQVNTWLQQVCCWLKMWKLIQTVWSQSLSCRLLGGRKLNCTHQQQFSDICFGLKFQDKLYQKNQTCFKIIVTSLVHTVVALSSL